MTTTLLIRADASEQTGYGHVMRCLALAHAWRCDGGDVLFCMASGAKLVRKRLEQDGMEVATIDAEEGSDRDADQLASLIEKTRPQWVVVDGYRFGPAYLQSVRKSGRPLLVIDDEGTDEELPAEIILNQNIHAHESLYPNRRPETTTLMGSLYILLRNEFLKNGAGRRTIAQKAKNILVTMGGSDHDNVTGKVIGALQSIPEIVARIVVGGANPHADAIKTLFVESGLQGEIIRDPSDMPRHMIWADIAVSAGGSSCWELAYLGVPIMGLILADNQRLIAEKLAEAKALLNLGWYEDFSAPIVARQVTELLDDQVKRRVMSRNAQKLVPGDGASAVVTAMRQKGVMAIEQI